MEQTSSLQLKPRHHDILLLLYRFRFLTRPQIQQLLNHKHHRQVIQWLNELTNQDYLTKYYDRNSAVIPAVYSLGKASRIILKQSGKPSTELKRIRWEKNYTIAFREKCLTIADIYLSLLTKSGETLRFWTKPELNATENLIEPAPDAYIVIGEGEKTRRYFLDVFTSVPSQVLRKRVEQYSDFWAEGAWQAQTQLPFPTVVILCSSQSSARRLSRYIAEDFSDEPDLRFLVSSDRSLLELQPKKKA